LAEAGERTGTFAQFRLRRSEKKRKLGGLFSPGVTAIPNSTPARQTGVREQEIRGGKSHAAMTHFRWAVCGLLFWASTINYMDRQVLAILAPRLQHIIGWNEIQYGYIVTAFQAAYAIGLLFIGGLIDWVGTRIGYALSISVWSLAAMSHALARTVFEFGAARFALGLGESGNFPAAIKAVAEWFPKKERALATGLFNSGTTAGAIIAPITVPFITLHFSWRWAFMFTGFFSATWLVVWLIVYRLPQRQPRVSKAELDLILQDPPERVERISWSRLLPHRQTWAFIVGKFLTDPIWWFFLFWLPKFLNATHGITIANVGPPLVTIYVAAGIGSVAGGWMSSGMLRRGWTVNRARKTAMLICALAVVPIVFAVGAKDLWTAVGLIALATAAHQGWSANLFTLASDMFPRSAVGSVTGIGGFGGAVGGMLIATFTGFLLQLTHSYFPVFLIAGSAYLTALLFIQLLAPKLQPVQLGDA
jgi:MFS transporter, ACS family, hexuronate transporter